MMDRDDLPDIEDTIPDEQDGAARTDYETAVLPLDVTDAVPWVRLADVIPEAVTWLWTGRIPRGKLTLLDGDPGLGKSTLTLDLAARVSRGHPMPGESGSREPAGVVILSAEDGLADTIAPRLRAAEADMTRIVAFPLEALPTLPDENATVADACADCGAALVIVDPLMAFLSGKVDAYRDHDVRRALQPLTALAEQTGAALLVVRHLTKQSGTKAVYRGGGSIGIGGAARSVLLVAQDPDDEARRVLAPVKSNLAAPAPALVFGLVANGGAAHVQWYGDSSHTADQLLAQPASENDRSAVDEAATLLHGALEGGPRPAKELERLRRDNGVSDWAWRQAKGRLGVRQQPAGFQGEWVWALPARVGGPGGPSSLDLSGSRLAEKPAPIIRVDGPARVDGPSGRTATVNSGNASRGDSPTAEEWL